MCVGFFVIASEEREWQSRALHCGYFSPCGCHAALAMTLLLRQTKKADDHSNHQPLYLIHLHICIFAHLQIRNLTFQTQA